MYVNRNEGMRVINYHTGKGYKVAINAYHVHINDIETGVNLFARIPEQDDWLDSRHQAIVDAINALEKAILAAV